MPKLGKPLQFERSHRPYLQFIKQREPEKTSFKTPTEHRANKAAMENLYGVIFKAEEEKEIERRGRRERLRERERERERESEVGKVQTRL